MNLHNSHPMTIERLQHAQKIAAQIVKVHGEDYLPYFEKLEEEIKRYSQKSEAYERALKLAS